MNDSVSVQTHSVAGFGSAPNMFKLYGNRQGNAARQGQPKYATRCTDVLLYEIGTGKCIGGVQKCFDIKSLAFSDDGRYITVGGKKGPIVIRY